MAEIQKAEPKTHKTLEQLFNEPCTIAIDRALMHQAFQIPGAGTESTLSTARTRDLKLVYHPGYGMIGFHKGKYFLSPAPNVIVAHE